MSALNHRAVLLTVGVVMVAFLSSTAAMADGSSCRGEKASMLRKTSHGIRGDGGTTTPMFRHLLKHKQDLGLTDEQITKLRALALDADRAAIRARRGDGCRSGTPRVAVG